MTTHRTERGPIETAARATVEALPLVEGSTFYVMGQLAIGLARSTDISTSKGHSAAAAQSGRELREVLGKLNAQFEVKAEEDPMDVWLAKLRDENSENLTDSAAFTANGGPGVRS